MNNKTEKWIEAGLILEKNPHIQLTCPSCNIGILEVVDKAVPENDKIDRYLICNNCKQWNVITMKSLT